MCMWFLVVRAITLSSPHLPFKHSMSGLACWNPSPVWVVENFLRVPTDVLDVLKEQLFLFFPLSAAVSGPQSRTDKEGLRSHFKSLSHYFTVTQKKKISVYIYVTVISFLASHFWLWFPSWRTLNETWAPLLVHIYFALRVCLICVNTNFDSARYTHTHTLSAPLLMGSGILHGTTAPNPVPRQESPQTATCLY